MNESWIIGSVCSRCHGCREPVRLDEARTVRGCHVQTGTESIRLENHEIGQCANDCVFL